MITKIKTTLARLIEGLISRLEKVQETLVRKKAIQPDFSSLAPVENGDHLNSYCEALLWAIQNRKKENIKNIALTGPYGSGKSSVLRTFQKKYKSRDIKVLNISLATFKEERDKGDGQLSNNQTDLLRLIEISILEQIFYHEKDRHVPDSQFKKIKSFSSWKLLLYAAGYLVLIAAVCNAVSKSLLKEIFKDHTFTVKELDTIHYLTYIIIGFGSLILLYKSVRIVSAISINKLKINDAEIGLGYASKSIMNKHFDELLYFFSVRPYNVVVIEDLDRFQETEIFTKLRELNLLLNNSEKTKQKEIVFIYAVRDDMFKDNDRTKFFDFIIPVIPIINSSNSSQILLQKAKQYNYTLQESFIDDISFFFQDMRLLHNVTNEFYLYKQNLSSSLIQTKLFAIITYKNIHPNDFVKLCQFHGDMYGLLHSKPKLIENMVQLINHEIQTLKEQIEALENTGMTNIKELRALYALEAMADVHEFVSFSINNKNITHKEVCEDKNFAYLAGDLMEYNYYRGVPSYTKMLKTIRHFSQIEQKVDPKKNYAEREKEVNDISGGKINELKKSISQLEGKKIKLQSSKFAEILRMDVNLKPDVPGTLNKELITMLLRKGYIAEDYLDYISLFHEGSITQKDHQFVISVKNMLQLDYDYPLTKIDKLITKLNEEDFQTSYILNYDLVDHLLQNSEKYIQEIEYIMLRLKDQSSESVNFIEMFLRNTRSVPLFLEHLCGYWTGIWSFYVNSPQKTLEEKQAILDFILQFASIQSIVDISKLSNFADFIKDDPLFLAKPIEENRMKEIIKSLEIHFNRIDFASANDKMLDYVYENLYYNLNPEILASMIKRYGKFDQPLFDRANYSAILYCGAEHIVNYMRSYINSYVKNVYLKIDSNVEEKEDQLLEILQFEGLEKEYKKSIISKVSTKVNAANSVVDMEILIYLLEESKVDANWANLLDAYNKLTAGENTERELPAAIISFLNQTHNAEILSKSKIPTTTEVGVNPYSDFFREVLECNDIEDSCYKLITRSSPWWYKDLPVGKLNPEKVKALINAQALEPTPENFSGLKEYHPELRILIIEKNYTRYTELVDSIQPDDTDIALILKSETIPSANKKIFLGKVADEKIIANATVLKLLAEKVKTESFSIGLNILQAILKAGNIDAEQRIKLFVSQQEKLDIVFIDDFLKSLPYSFQQIRDRSMKAIIPDTAINVQFLQVLDNKGYISSFSDTDKGLRIHHKRINPDNG